MQGSVGQGMCSPRQDASFRDAWAGGCFAARACQISKWGGAPGSGARGQLNGGGLHATHFPGKNVDSIGLVTCKKPIIKRNAWSQQKDRVPAFSTHLRVF